MNRISIASRMVLVISIVLCGAMAVHAHPHVFLDTRVTFRAGTDGLEGVVVEWTFDEWFSASVIFDHDANEDGSFDRNEIKSVYDGAFSNLQNYDYFTYVSAGGETFPVTTVEEFTARIVKDRVVYTFFVPFSVPFNGDSAEFSVAVYDKTFFCDVTYHEDKPVLLRAPQSLSLDYAIETDESVTITYSNLVVGGGRPAEEYTGVAHPQAVRVVLTR